MGCSNCNQPKTVVGKAIQKAVNITTAYKNKITGNITPEAKERINICRVTCKKYTTIFKIDFCNECGCPIDIKALAPKEFCKLNKW